MFKYHLTGLLFIVGAWLAMRYVELFLEVPETRLVEFDCLHVRTDPRITEESAKGYQNLVKYCPYDLLDDWAQLRYTPDRQGPQRKEILVLVLNRRYTDDRTAKNETAFSIFVSGDILMYDQATKTPVLKRAINDRSFKNYQGAESILVTTYPISQFEQTFIDFRFNGIVTTPLQPIFGLQLSWSLWVHSIPSGPQNSKASSIHLSSGCVWIALLLYCLFRRKLRTSNIPSIMRPVLISSLALSLVYTGLDLAWNHFHMSQLRINQITEFMYPLFKLSLCSGLILLLHQHLDLVVKQVLPNVTSQKKKWIFLGVGAFSFIIPGAYLLITFLNNFERNHLPLISGMNLARNRVFAKLGVLLKVAQVIFVAGFVMTSLFALRKSAENKKVKKWIVIVVANIVLLMVGDYLLWNVGMLWSERLLKQAVICFNAVSLAITAMKSDEKEKIKGRGSVEDDEESERINK